MGDQKVDTSMVLFCSLFFVITAPSAASLCRTIKIDRTVYQTARRGDYTLMSTSFNCYSKRIWKQIDGNANNYIYYHGSINGWNGWMVSTAPCGNTGGIASSRASAHASSPDQVTGGWEEAIGFTWHPTRVTFRCTDGNGVSSIVGVCIGVALAGVTIIAGGLWCFYKHKKANDPGQQRLAESAENRGRQNISFASDPTDPVQPPAYSEVMDSHNNAPPSYEEATLHTAMPSVVTS